MPKTMVKWNRGAKRLTGAWDPRKMDAAMRRHMRRASAINGKLAEAEARQVIRTSRNLQRNAPLTVALKGENKPLVGLTAELFRAITSKATSPNTVFVGVLRTDSVYNVAKTIHEGTTIPVTPAMRGLFFVLWKASTGDIDPSALTGRAAELWDQMSSGWKPLKKSTTAIVIPSRPFMDIAFESARLMKRAQTNWQKAFQTAVNERAKGQ